MRTVVGFNLRDALLEDPAAKPTTPLPDALNGVGLAGGDPADVDVLEASAHRVELDAYAGPLDLLLYLVKRHEIDLLDIPMAELVAQYLEHVRAIQVIDVDQAGGFLLMAATLVEVKSRTLVPAAAAGTRTDRNASDPADPGVAADPRLELVQQLLAYQRFKEAATALEAGREAWEARHPAAAGRAEELTECSDDLRPLDLSEVNVMDLAAAFGRAVEALGHVGDHRVEADDTPISLYTEDLVDRLTRDGGSARALMLGELIAGRRRTEAIGLFLALLELVRQRRLTVCTGEGDGAPVRLALRDPERAGADDDAAQARAAAPPPDADDLDAYEWVQPGKRARHARRLRRRAERAGAQEKQKSDAAKAAGDPAL